MFDCCVFLVLSLPPSPPLSSTGGGQPRTGQPSYDGVADVKQTRAGRSRYGEDKGGAANLGVAEGRMSKVMGAEVAATEIGAAKAGAAKVDKIFLIVVFSFPFSDAFSGVAVRRNRAAKVE
jgi:hypothetical protein